MRREWAFKELVLPKWKLKDKVHQCACCLCRGIRHACRQCNCVYHAAETSAFYDVTCAYEYLQGSSNWHTDINQNQKFFEDLLSAARVCIACMTSPLASWSINKYFSTIGSYTVVLLARRREHVLYCKRCECQCQSDKPDAMAIVWVHGSKSRKRMFITCTHRPYPWLQEHKNTGVYASKSQWTDIMGSSYTGGSGQPIWYRF